MNIDEMDVRIIRILDSLAPDEAEEISTYNMTKKLFLKASNAQIRQKDKLIQYRLRKLARMNIIEVEKKEGITYYGLIASNVFVGFIWIDRIKQKSCCIKINGGWVAYPI